MKKYGVHIKMLKYYKLIIIVIFAIFFLCACAGNQEIIKTEDEVLSERSIENRVFESSSEHSRLYYDNETFMYSYEVFNKKGELLEAKNELSGIVFLEEFSNGIVHVAVSAGSYARYEWFYDVENGKVSDKFFNISAIQDRKIAYMDFIEDEACLVIRDIFDKKIFYKEIYRDFFETAVPAAVLLDVEFADKDKISIRYLSGKEGNTVSETINLIVSESKESEEEEALATQIMNGNFTVLNESAEDIAVFERIGELYFDAQKYEWEQCDIKGDGYRDLILQEKEASVNGLKQIVFVFSCSPNDARCIICDTVDMSEFYTLGKEGRLIYYCQSLGAYEHYSYRWFDWDKDWNHKLVYGLEMHTYSSDGSWEIERCYRKFFNESEKIGDTRTYVDLTEDEYIKEIQKLCEIEKMDANLIY